MWEQCERVVGFFCSSTKDEVVPFAGEEQLNVSPTVVAARREERGGVDLLIATDDSIMYCDRKLLKFPLMRLYATDLWKVIGSRKDKGHPETDRSGSRNSPRPMNVLNRAL
jgi:hypothetical protein